MEDVHRAHPPTLNSVVQDSEKPQYVALTGAQGGGTDHSKINQAIADLRASLGAK